MLFSKSLNTLVSCPPTSPQAVKGTGIVQQDGGMEWEVEEELGLHLMPAMVQGCWCSCRGSGGRCRDTQLPH